MTAPHSVPQNTGSAPSPSLAAALTPEERLARSRAKLRAWYLETYGDAPEHAAAGKHQRREDKGAEKDDPSWLGAIFDILADVPAATVAARWLRNWWARHPLRATADLATALTREVAEPLAKRHPWVLVGGAVFAGMLVSRMRPWRWISGGAILASLMPRVDLNTLLHWFTVAINDLGARQKQAKEQSSHAEPAETPPRPDAPNTEMPRSSSLH